MKTDKVLKIFATSELPSRTDLTQNSNILLTLSQFELYKMKFLQNMYFDKEFTSKMSARIKLS